MDTAEQLGRIESKLDTALEQLNRHDKVLFGNGDGLVVKVDRLTVAEANDRWAWRTVFVALLALIGRAIWGFFQHSS